METYKETGKKEWSYEEIVSGFKEWYGIDVGELYYKEALRILIDKKIIRYDESSKKYILLIA